MTTKYNVGDVVIINIPLNPNSPPEGTFVKIQEVLGWRGPQEHYVYQAIWEGGFCFVTSPGTTRYTVYGSTE